MTSRLERTRVLPAGGLRALQSAKQQIQDAAVGKLPEHLALAAAQAAVRCARDERALSEVLSPNVAALVRETLTGLGREPEGMPDTMPKMAKSIGPLRTRLLRGIGRWR